MKMSLLSVNIKSSLEFGYKSAIVILVIAIAISIGNAVFTGVLSSGSSAIDKEAAGIWTVVNVVIALAFIGLLIWIVSKLRRKNKSLTELTNAKSASAVAAAAVAQERAKSSALTAQIAARAAETDIL